MNRVDQANGREVPHILGGQDTDEGRDKLWSEALEHLRRHGSCEHGSSGELLISYQFQSEGWSSLQVQ